MFVFYCVVMVCTVRYIMLVHFVGFKFCGFWFLSMIIYEVLYPWCLRYNICSTWFLDIRLSTCVYLCIPMYIYTYICVYIYYLYILSIYIPISCVYLCIIIISHNDILSIFLISYNHMQICVYLYTSAHKRYQGNMVLTHATTASTVRQFCG